MIHIFIIYCLLRFVIDTNSTAVTTDTDNDATAAITNAMH